MKYSFTIRRGEWKRGGSLEIPSKTSGCAYVLLHSSLLGSSDCQTHFEILGRVRDVVGLDAIFGVNDDAATSDGDKERSLAALFALADVEVLFA